MFDRKRPSGLTNKNVSDADKKYTGTYNKENNNVLGSGHVSRRLKYIYKKALMMKEDTYAYITHTKSENAQHVRILSRECIKSDL